MRKKDKDELNILGAAKPRNLGFDVKWNEGKSIVILSNLAVNTDIVPFSVDQVGIRSANGMLIRTVPPPPPPSPTPTPSPYSFIVTKTVTILGVSGHGSVDLSISSSPFTVRTTNSIYQTTMSPTISGIAVTATITALNTIKLHFTNSTGGIIGFTTTVSIYIR